MRTKILIAAIAFTVLAIAVSATYVLAHWAPSSSYYGVTDSRVDADDWWNEMREHMEEHWEELENYGYFSYGHYGRYGGIRGYGGCHW